MSRRNAKPPYEIMNGPHRPDAAPARTGGSRRGHRSISLPDGSKITETLSAWGQNAAEWSGKAREALRTIKPDSAWWIGSSAPVVMKLTKGTVVTGVAGVVGLVLLAYWIGLGHNGAVTGPDGEGLAANSGAKTGESAPWALDDVPGADLPGGYVVPIPRHLESEPTDPRIPGQNYLVYTMADLPEAQRLQGFLAEHGVRTLIVPTRHKVPGVPGSGVAETGDSDDTAVLHLVVDVTEGFSRQAYLQNEHRPFLARRLKLGRAWQRHNGGHGSALESMMFYKYDPPVDPAP